MNPRFFSNCSSKVPFTLFIIIAMEVMTKLTHRHIFLLFVTKINIILVQKHDYNVTEYQYILVKNESEIFFEL